MNGEIDEFLKAYLMMMGQKKNNIYNKLLVEKYLLYQIMDHKTS
jgi:hypothetical protein